ncbi:hypothetical protein ILUMI_06571 [Ignelater luminosus]|uniref:Uncharacterized protein n=1 Tax=Ignelater luminosus TaxID=2038154 RepID=A0A8K0D5H8_IGNLU|nr:hypothetical protein ILUMI_06571 [Ignelater luminosus]
MSRNNKVSSPAINSSTFTELLDGDDIPHSLTLILQSTTLTCMLEGQDEHERVFTAMLTVNTSSSHNLSRGGALRNHQTKRSNFEENLRSRKATDVAVLRKEVKFISCFARDLRSAIARLKCELDALTFETGHSAIYKYWYLPEEERAVSSIMKPSTEGLFEGDHDAIYKAWADENEQGFLEEGASKFQKASELCERSNEGENTCIICISMKLTKLGLKREIPPLRKYFTVDVRRRDRVERRQKAKYRRGEDACEFFIESVFTLEQLTEELLLTGLGTSVNDYLRFVPTSSRASVEAASARAAILAGGTTPPPGSPLASSSRATTPRRRHFG